MLIQVIEVRLFVVKLGHDFVFRVVECVLEVLKPFTIFRLLLLVLIHEALTPL